VAASVAEYGTPAVAAGNATVVSVSGVTVTVMDSSAVAEAGELSESVTSAMKLTVPPGTQRRAADLTGRGVQHQPGWQR
jgi:hypothetical protein